MSTENRINSELAAENESLKAERDALAVENASTNERVQKLIQIISNADNDYCMCGDAMKNHIHGGCGHPTGMFDYHYNQWLESDNETPATNAALAAIQAQGVEKAAAALDALSAQSASATTQGNFRAAAVYLRTAVIPAIGEAK